MMDGFLIVWLRNQESGRISKLAQDQTDNQLTLQYLTRNLVRDHERKQFHLPDSMKEMAVRNGLARKRQLRSRSAALDARGRLVDGCSMMAIKLADSAH